MLRLARYIASVALTALGAFVVSADMSAAPATDLFAKPDFAFPRKVKDSASLALKKALAAKDSRAMLRALINESLAETAVSADSTQAVIDHISAIRAAETQPDACAMLDLLLAQVYTSLYNADRSTYDERPSTLGEATGPVDQWSGQQMKDAVMARLDNAFSYADALRSTPVEAYKGVITISPEAVKAYSPSLLDFAAERALAIYRSFSYGDALSAMRATTLIDRMITEDASNPAEALRWRLAKLDTDAYTNLSPAERTTALWNLYSNFSSLTPTSVSVLEQLSDITDSNDNAATRRLYAAAREFVEAHPDFYRVGAAKNILAQLTSRNANLSCSSTLYPGQSLPVELTMRNVRKATVTLYKVPASMEISSYYVRVSRCTKVREIPVSAPESIGDTPFFAKVTEQLKVDDPGRYILTVSFPGMEKQREESGKVLTVTRLSSFTARLDNTAAYAVNSLSGEPLKGVTFNSVSRRSASAKPRAIGKTDKDGSLIIPALSSSLIFASSGTDRSLPIDIWGNDKISWPQTDYFVQGLTALPVYHPGDSIQWTAIAYKASGYTRELLRDRTVKAELRDVNYRLVASDSLITDRWGRVNGSFPIPSDLLTGNFTIRLYLPDGNRNLAITNFSVLVSDYKLPTFRVENLQSIPDQSGDYTVTGRLATYTGLPVASAKVTLNLSSTSPRFWWNSAPPASYYTAEATSDSEGRFSFTIPAATIKEAPYPRGMFQATAVAVSTAGESRQATVAFSAAKLCMLQVSLPEVNDITSPLVPEVKLTDPTGTPIDKTVRYTVLRDTLEVASGEFASSKPRMDLASVTPGEYTLRFSVPDFPESVPFDISGVTLYRPTGAPSPSTRPVWCPVSSVTTSADGKATLIFGTPEGEGHILFILSDPADARVLERRWITVPGGMTSLQVKLPSGIDHAWAALTSTRDFRTTVANVELKRPAPHGPLVLACSTMRDHTSPLAEEKWTFTLRYADGTPAEGALMMDVYSKALEKIASQDWSFRPSRGPVATLSINSPFAGRIHSGASEFMRYVNVPSVQAPAWEFWGRSFDPRSNKYFYYDDGEVLTNMVATSARLSMKSARAYGAADAVVEEAADTAAPEAANEESAGEASTDSGASASPAIDYRPSEIPLALYKPTLATNARGELEMTFHVPNAVTTWQADIFAYTSDLATAALSKQIVSAKTLMVQPNLPRFVRSGDVVELLTTVYNKSDAPLTAEVTATATNPADGSTVASSSATVTVPPSGSAVTSLPVKVAVAAGGALECTVTARSGNYTDGERSLVPVLTSSASIIESTPFYILPKETSASVELPRVPADGTLSLQVCDNPLWLAVLALPSVAEPDAVTATGATSQLLISLAAKNVVQRFPEVAKAITRWNSEGASDSTLVSMLRRDPSLKQLMLQSTPWMRQAASDSERMQRLALLLDGDFADRQIRSSVTTLRNLQGADGGWKWYDGCAESSEWTTYSVLWPLGLLNQLGWLPADREFTEMLRKAVTFLDDKVARELRRNPAANFVDYTLLRDKFSFDANPGATQAMHNAVRQALKEWKGAGAVRKAQLAMLLQNNGHADAAREALASLGEYAISSPERGMWWDGVDVYGQSVILDAYHLLKPRGDEQDLIRQWIIFQKEATDWGNSPQASLIVARLLTSSPTWVEPSRGVQVTLAGAPVQTPLGDYGSGFFTMPLDPAAASGKTLAVSREGDTPAWGAVVSRYLAEAKDVKAHSIPGLSIQKELLAGRPARDGMKWETGGAITLGDQVLVRLTVKTDRDIDYVTVVDDNSACFEPVEQTPAHHFEQGVGYYLEPKDAQTRLFFERLPKGTYLFTYPLSANNAGRFTGGVATLQSQMTPSLTAHSAGKTVVVSHPQNNK